VLVATRCGLLALLTMGIVGGLLFLSARHSRRRRRSRARRCWALSWCSRRACSGSTPHARAARPRPSGGWTSKVTASGSAPRPRMRP
jgi:hypothetical protein